MRKVICYEGRWDMDHFLEHGSIKMPEEEGEKVPLVGQAFQQAPILGWAEDFERDSRMGCLTANIDCLDESARTVLENKDAGVTIGCNALTRTQTDLGVVVADATLQYVFLDPNLPWKDEM